MMRKSKDVLAKLDELDKKLDALTAAGIEASRKLRETNDNLKNIHLFVKSANIKHDMASDSYTLEVEYSAVGRYTIFREEDMGSYVSDTFRSVNLLNLITVKEMSDLQKKIDEMKSIRKDMMK